MSNLPLPHRRVQQVLDEIADRDNEHHYAKRLVCFWVNAQDHRDGKLKGMIPSQFEIVSYSKVMGHWKSILTVPGSSRFYELTYDDDEKQFLISEYHRVRSDKLEALS